MVGAHEEIMQTAKICKGKASIYFFLCNGRLENCKQIYECRFGLTIYKERWKKFNFVQ